MIMLIKVGYFYFYFYFGSWLRLNNAKGARINGELTIETLT
jgi:hypothetical protein